MKMESHNLKSFETESFRLLLKSLSESKVDKEKRQYIADNLLPVLFMALPKLLQAVDKNRDINAIEWLGQYLFRHNPRYKPSLIANGMGSVTSIEDDSLANVRDHNSSLSSAEEKEQRISRLCVGAKVRANFAGKGHWYPAKVSAANPDGSYVLEYADGDWEDDAKIENIEVKKKHVLQNDLGEGRGGTVCIGDKVRARFAGKGHWYPATVRSINGDGTFGLEYADGDFEDDARREHIEKKCRR